jgi:hypothetical protein
MASLNKAPAIDRCSNTAARAEWDALPIPLRECGEIAGQRLSVMLFDALHQVEEALFSASTQALTRGECELMLNATEFVRVRRERMVEDFSRHFEQRYASACKYKPVLMTSFQIDFDASQLAYVKHDLLDDSLEPGKLAEAIQNAGWVALQALTRLFGTLLAAEALKPNDMPLSPKLIEAAVADAARDQPWRHEAKSLVVRSLRRFIPDQVGLIYRDICQHIICQHMAPMVGHVEGVPMPASMPSDTPARLAPPQLLAEPVVGLIEPVIEVPGEAPVEVTLDTVKQAANGQFDACQAIELALQAMRGEVARRQLAPTALVSEIANPESAEPAAPPVKQEPIPVVPRQETQSADRLSASLDELRLGAWLELRDAEGAMTALKVAWISPQKHLYLMTNRQRGRALSMAAEELEAALREGRARIVESREADVSSRFAATRHGKKTA